MVMFDSLNRHMLPNYGCDWTHAPNFRRLGERTVTFNRSYVCSMPCMPARRDLHTGRPNFLHRSWGPLEPFDDSVPQMLGEAGVRTHLATDHYHYFQDGGATYHPRYNTWEFFRGQEGDAWKGQVADPTPPPSLGRNAAANAMTRQDWVNRGFMRREADQPQPQTFDAGLDFIRRNHQQDQWFLQLETFDPHEPFFTQGKYKDLYAAHYDQYRKAGGKHFDWPLYRLVQETPEEIEHLRYEYASLLSMCDAQLGRVLDMMDELDLWQDTMLIVWTDHGFMLGEKNCLAKIWMPFYEEVAHTPFFVWDPRCGACGVRRDALVQPSIDLGPTLLGFYGLPATKDMLGKDLAGTIASDAPVREAAIFGLHGAQVNVTDGRYVYMRSAAHADGQPLFNYTLMPTHMSERFSVQSLRKMEPGGPFSFTKECPVMKLPAPVRGVHGSAPGTHLLYDLEADPTQQEPIQNEAVEGRMVDHLIHLMRQCDAPSEQFVRLGLHEAASRQPTASA
jgi:arylsulfatase A-like enzyme